MSDRQTATNGSTGTRPRVMAGGWRGSLIAGVDIGTTKVCCFIGRLGHGEPRVLGIGHQISRGVRNGALVDLDAVGQSIAGAVHAAEEMAGTTIERVVVSLSGGFAASRIVKAEITLPQREISDADMRQVLARGYMMREANGRYAIHSIPVGFSIDDSRGIRDPRGMIGERLGVNMHIVNASLASVRNQTAAVARAHLGVDALVVSPYAAGLACLVDDEMDLGVTVIDMGGGTTTIGVFFDNNLVFADSVPIGGCHVTNDIARGLSTPLANAERMKALFGSAITAALDDRMKALFGNAVSAVVEERETIAVPQVGEEDDGHVSHVPKSLLVSIIAPRIEETLELVRDRLEASGVDKVAGRRVVLTGGACQLHGVRELAGLILDKQVRIGRPIRVTGLAEATHGPAFSTAAGLLQFAGSEEAVPSRSQGAAAAGIFGRVSQWVRQNF